MLDNFLRPVLIKRGVNLSMLLILAGVLGGMFAFGIVGLFRRPGDSGGGVDLAEDVDRRPVNNGAY